MGRPKRVHTRANRVNPGRHTAGKRLTMADVKRINAEQGYYFFSRPTMKFFNSRIESELLGQKYFITSERMDSEHPRNYRVREFNKVTGNITTVESGLSPFKTKEEARRYVMAMLGS